MRYEVLCKRNPSVDATTMARYNALYQGGEEFKRHLRWALPRNPLEGEDVYKLRCREAYYRSYVGAIVDFFAAELFAAPFAVRASTELAEAEPPSEREPETDSEPPSERELASTPRPKTEPADPYYAALKEDCDGCGTDLASFAKKLFVEAVVDGAAWVLAELPDDDGAPPRDRGEWNDRGLGAARLKFLDAKDVLDWEVDSDGGLLWATTYACSWVRPDPRSAQTLKRETWRIYDRETVETFEIVYDPDKVKLKKDTDVPSVGVMSHRFPRVPLLRMTPADGLWLLERTADAQLEHFRLSCALSWSTKRACYPMAIFYAEGEESMPVAGPGYIQRIGIREKFEWIAPSTAPLEHLAKQIREQRDEIYRLGLQMANSVDNNATALGRSGESKAADAASAEVILKAYAGMVRECIEEIFELVSDARGDTETTFSIEGMDTFSLEGLTAALAALQTGLDMGIPSSTLIRELRTRAADMLLPTASQEVKDAVRAEIAQAGAAKTTAPRVEEQARNNTAARLNGSNGVKPVDNGATT